MKNNKFICFFVLFAILFFAASIARADNIHHSIVYEENYTYPAASSIENAKNYTYAGTALAIASGQHHYKATTSLQWSVGAGYVDDNSAVSFGLGLQSGKVFISGNFSSDGSTSAVGFGASGTF